MTISVDSLGELEKIFLSIAVADPETPEEALEDIVKIKAEAARALKMMGYDNDMFDMLGIAKEGGA